MGVHASVLTVQARGIRALDGCVESTKYIYNTLSSSPSKYDSVDGRHALEFFSSDTADPHGISRS